MTELFGATRSVIKGRFALLAPGGFAAGNLPGWEKATAFVQISPAMGAGFCQSLITLGRDAEGRGNTGALEYFVYVVEGSGALTVDEKKHRFEAGNFAYIPPGKDIFFQGSVTPMKLLVLQKKYLPLAGAARPQAVFGLDREVKAQPLADNADIKKQALLPEGPGFDLAVNLLTYAPGAALPAVETHYMEHGILMLKGQGLQRLESDHYPVQAGDVIWAAPYCPQWFVAVGKVPAVCLVYQDVNRDPI